MKVAKSFIYAQTHDSDLLKRFITYNPKYLQTLLFAEKWRSFANSLPSMQKLRSTVHEVVSQLLRPR